PAGAATVTYTSSATYFADAGPQSLQDFNVPISSTATSITYNDLIVSCSGSSLCSPGFFGTSSISIDGLSVFFSSPSLVTFSFNSSITSFGIFIAGLGTISPGSTTFSIANSNGFSSVLFSNYSGTTTSFDSSLFAGLISDLPFTSVTLAGTQIGDGVFLDNLSYGLTPLPAALPLFTTGLSALAVLGWRRKRKAAPIAA
ncbi:MAG TPA: VPLPA-CTERM sorting domain-containing protein, partial [Candidatus Paceibacterota bacterium]